MDQLCGLNDGVSHPLSSSFISASMDENLKGEKWLQIAIGMSTPILAKAEMEYINHVDDYYGDEGRMPQSPHCED